MNEHIAKPFDIEKVNKILKSVMEKGQGNPG